MLKVVGASEIRTIISFSILLGVLIFGILMILVFRISKDDEKFAATVYWNAYREQYEVSLWGQNNDPDKISLGVARAYYQSSMYETGWSILEIQTAAKYPDGTQAFAAGILEGVLSWKYIYWQWTNTIEQPCIQNEEFCQEFREFLKNNTVFVKAVATEKDKTDPFWHQIALFYSQLDGLEFGWHYEVKKNQKFYNIPKTDFLWMNIMADFKDIENIMYPFKNVGNPPSPASMSLLKLLSKNNGTFVLGHSSSGFYSSMLRIQKKYNFNYHFTGLSNSKLIPGRTISFTSYPGSIYSQDDFYQISLENKSKITITGTAINIDTNQSRNKNEITDKVFLGPRVMAANRLTQDGKSWAVFVQKFNSGTGNKQWLYIQSKNNKTELWVVEQIHQVIISMNETKTLYQRSYWISCGISYYQNFARKYFTKQNVYKSLNNSIIEDTELILQLGQKNVTDIQSLINLMRGPYLSFVGRTDLRFTQELPMNLNPEFPTMPKINNNQEVIKNSSNNCSQNEVLKFIHYNLNRNDIIIKRNESWYHIYYLKNIVSLTHQTRSNYTFWQKTLENNFTLTLSSKNNNINEGNKSFYIINGIIDLKVVKDGNNFLAAAGPPFNLNDKHLTVEPFQWSKSRIKYLPHYGHSDIWNYEPIVANFAWD